MPLFTYYILIQKTPECHFDSMKLIVLYINPGVLSFLYFPHIIIFYWSVVDVPYYMLQLYIIVIHNF